MNYSDSLKHNAELSILYLSNLSEKIAKEDDGETNYDLAVISSCIFLIRREFKIANNNNIVYIAIEE